MTIPVDEAGVVAFTQALVRIPSVNDAPNGRSEQAAADLVAAKMREFGWEPLVSLAAPGRPNVVAVVEGGGGDGPTLMFEGHTDVVTEGALDTWTVDPYGGEVRDGRLYGRGAADMKSGVAAMLYAVRALQRSGPFPGRIKVCALADEEGLMLGVHHFVDSGLAADVDAAIVCEPEGGEICPVSKGAIRLRVDFHGRMAHGAMPQHARNPIRTAAAFVSALAELEAELHINHDEHEHLGWPYITPTVARAGDLDQINVIPPTATVAVDVRTVPGIDHADLVDRVNVLASALGATDGVFAEVTVLVDRPPVDTPIDAPVVAALAAAHTAVTGSGPTYGGVPGSTDGTILTARAGVPSVVYGPGGKWIAHQADEYVEVDEIVLYTKVYAEAARQFLNGHGLGGVRLGGVR
ncbi:M20 family metallopeptidase [Planosporangium flavigriseum]|uniref:Probable succinyl-diaminopimelate desuccinylase n=1 Tax=Planosporangium flavigriseum TaxID=373681 RepID=A0A8J3PM12_9ACTN|nr:M20 family metallopeptidase [Planosporangium flavigriseum]NJC66029.1 M20 family metallopeptidase [Planosporangium flavigriseum]GIG75061.1 acetylornithine deacetylase [Planosporangium flavigriseum]